MLPGKSFAVAVILDSCHLFSTVIENFSLVFQWYNTPEEGRNRVTLHVNKAPHPRVSLQGPFWLADVSWPVCTAGMWPLGKQAAHSFTSFSVNTGKLYIFILSDLKYNYFPKVLLYWTTFFKKKKDQENNLSLRRLLKIFPLKFTFSVVCFTFLCKYACITFITHYS